ncbi:slit homolog 2 protein [Aplysia californica]|uniref:Slit homolog 2 protein n=1 Tax=Aplysia californica TaxID=6500 RepID=A0ABM1W4Z7_APLCA|nr:slit homolog 2 protein [Aplysia californica]
MVKAYTLRLRRMYHTLLVVCILGVTVSAQCPGKCSCSPAGVRCRGLRLTVVIPTDYVNISITNSNLKSLDNTSFGRNIEHFIISESIITSIAPSAFTGLVNVRSITFYSTTITAIKPCSFSSIRHSASISFELANIADIERGAFSNLKGLQQLTFKGSHIETIHSDAFFDFDVQRFLLDDTEIPTLETGAFNGKVEVNELNFTGVSFTTIKSQAFIGFSRISRSVITSCRFEILYCNPLPYLYQATQAAKGTFSLSNSSFVCDCFTVPLMNFINVNSIYIPSSVLCVLPPTGSRVPFNATSVSDACPQKLDLNCGKKVRTPMTLQCGGEVLIPATTNPNTVHVIDDVTTNSGRTYTEPHQGSFSGGQNQNSSAYRSSSLVMPLKLCTSAVFIVMLFY